MYPIPLFPKAHLKGTSFVVYELDDNDKVNLNPGIYLLTFKVGYMLMNYLCNRKELVAYNRGFVYNGKTANEFKGILSAGEEIYTSFISRDKPIHCIIRDPYKRFLSGLVQVALVPAQQRTTLKFMDTNKHKILRKVTGGPSFKITKYAEGKFIDYLVDFFNNWLVYSIGKDAHLSAYHNALYHFMQSYKELDIKIINLEEIHLLKIPEQQKNEIKHSNSFWYPLIEKALQDSRIKPRIRRYITAYTESEIKYYKKLKALSTKIEQPTVYI